MSKSFTITASPSASDQGRKCPAAGRPRLLDELVNPAWIPSDRESCTDTDAVSSDGTQVAKPAGIPAVPTVIPVHSGKEPVSVLPSCVPSTSQPARPLRVAVYCRVSTRLESQETSYDNQQAEYMNRIRRNPSWIFAGIYSELISATGRKRRPELDRLVRDCREGLIDLVLTKSISRLARNTAELLSIVRELTALGVRIHFEKERLRTESMGSEFLITVLAAFAEEESHSISGNVKWGIRRQFRDGTYKIPTPVYGYLREGSVYMIDDDKACVVRQIFAEVLSGAGAGLIASMLNAKEIPSARGGRWTKCSVLRIVQNVFYCGDALFQQTCTDERFHQKKNKGQLDQYLAEDHHAPIVSRADFELANRVIREHSTKQNSLQGRRGSTNRYPLSGRLRCGRCGAPMGRASGKYRCGGRVQHLCTIQDVYEEDIYSLFATVLNKIFYLEKTLQYFRIMADCHTKEKCFCRLESYGIGLTRTSSKTDPFFYRKHADKIHSLPLPDRWVEKQVSELKQHVLDRGIRPACTEEDREILPRLVDRIEVRSQTEATFFFTCGLILTEDASVQAACAAGQTV